MSEQAIDIVVCTIGFVFVTSCFAAALYIGVKSASARIAFLQSPAYDLYLRNQVEALFIPSPADPGDPQAQRTDHASGLTRAPR